MSKTRLFGGFNHSSMFALHEKFTPPQLRETTQKLLEGYCVKMESEHTTMIKTTK
jgi:hypothetical protein